MDKRKDGWLLFVATPAQPMKILRETNTVSQKCALKVQCAIKTMRTVIF